jgi:hypothetical protein
MPILKLAPPPPAASRAAHKATPARSSVHVHLANAGAAALVAASLLVADPALAFIVRPSSTLFSRVLSQGSEGDGMLTAMCVWCVGAGRRPVREAGDAGAGPHRQGLQRPDARQAGLQDGITAIRPPFISWLYVFSLDRLVLPRFFLMMKC